jgi:hypothetical protein
MTLQSGWQFVDASFLIMFLKQTWFLIHFDTVSLHAPTSSIRDFLTFYACHRPKVSSSARCVSVAYAVCRYKHILETGFCLRLQVKPTQLGPIDRASPYLWTPVPIPR